MACVKIYKGITHYEGSDYTKVRARFSDNTELNLVDREGRDAEEFFNYLKEIKNVKERIVIKQNKTDNSKFAVVSNYVAVDDDSI